MTPSPSFADNARKAAKDVVTLPDALAWRCIYLYPHIEDDALYDELVELDREIVARVLGVGGG